MKRLNDSQNIRFGVVLSYASMIVSLLGTLFVTNRILLYIGDYNYGLYSFVISITSWLSIFSSALTASFLRFSTIESKQTNGDSSRINTIYFKLLLILGLAIFIVGSLMIMVLLLTKTNFLNYSWTDSEKMYYIFLFSILNISLTMPVSVFPLFITYRKKFVFEKINTIIVSIVTFIGNFLIAFLTRNIIYISLFSILVTFLSFLTNFVYSKRVLSITFSKTPLFQDNDLLKGILLFSSILLLNSIVDQINHNMDKTLLGIFSVPEDVTLYQVGHQFAAYLLVMSTAVSSVFSPTINKLVVDENDKEINRLFLKISHFQLIVVCLVAFGFCACGDSFVKWWIGDSRLGAFYVGSLLMLFNISPLTFNSSIEIQRAKNKHLFRAITYVLAAILNVGLSIVFLFIFPKEKAIFACLAGTGLSITVSHWILMNIYNRKVIKLPVKSYLLLLVKYIAIGLITFGLVYALNRFLLENYISNNLLLFVIKGFAFVLLFSSLVIAIDGRFVVTNLKAFLYKSKK